MYPDVSIRLTDFLPLKKKVLVIQFTGEIINMMLPTKFVKILTPRYLKLNCNYIFKPLSNLFYLHLKIHHFHVLN